MYIPEYLILELITVNKCIYSIWPYKFTPTCSIQEMTETYLF